MDELLRWLDQRMAIAKTRLEDSETLEQSQYYEGETEAFAEVRNRLIRPNGVLIPASVAGSLR